MTEPERPPLAMMNGEIVPYDQAKISIMAPGLTFAVLAFEGLRCDPIVNPVSEKPKARRRLQIDGFARMTLGQKLLQDRMQTPCMTVSY